MDKKEKIFLKFQKYCYEELDKIIDDGWDDKKYKLEMPPEFILSLLFLPALLSHKNLCREGKQDLLKGFKRIVEKYPENLDDFFEEQNTGKKTLDMVKNSILN